MPLCGFPPFFVAFPPSFGSGKVSPALCRNSCSEFPPFSCGKWDFHSQCCHLCHVLILLLREFPDSSFPTLPILYLQSGGEDGTSRCLFISSPSCSPGPLETHPAAKLSLKKIFLTLPPSHSSSQGRFPWELAEQDRSHLHSLW